MKQRFKIQFFLFLLLAVSHSHAQTWSNGASHEWQPKLSIDTNKDDFTTQAKEAAIIFEQGNGKYAFDTWNPVYQKSLQLRARYDGAKFDTGYGAFKFIPAGKSDEVIARIEIKDKSIDPDKIFFQTKNGTRYQVPYQNGAYRLTLPSAAVNDGYELYAFHPKGMGYITLGKLVVLSYPTHEQKVVLVKVNGANIDEQAVKEKFDDIYHPVGVNWSVSTDAFSYSGDVQFFESSSGLLDAYTTPMKALQSAYMQEREIDAGTAYVFIFENGESSDELDRSKAGFMPRGKQFGYIFKNGFGSTENLCIGIAHELGHGQFQLKHPFDNSYGLKEKELPENLMDYKDGTSLAKWQWDGINDPGLVNRLFERDEDGMLVSGNPKVLVLIEEEGFGHTCLGLYTSNGLQIYTFGRYNGSYIPSSGGFGPIGDGILVRYQNKTDVDSYIKEHLNKGGTAKIYMLFLDNISQIEYFLRSKWEAGDVLLSDNQYFYTGRKIGTYILSSNNCTTLTVEALKEGGFDVMKEAINLETPSNSTWAPLTLSSFFKYFIKTPKQYQAYDVTEQFRKK